MARGVNKVILIGNLGDEPTLRTTTTGKNVATISMVTNESRRNAETGEYTEFAEWHHVVMWGKLADIAKQYLHKGSQIYVEGKLRTRSYMDKQNQKRYVTEIVADEMQMLGSRPQGAQGGYQASPRSASYGSGGQNNYGSQNSGAYGSQNGAGNGAQNAGSYGAQPQQGYSQSAAPESAPRAPEPAVPVEPDNGPINDDIPF
ncbi:MAG: single-stranded DNA-binding protein [Succinivibrio sp.]|jgi:single-strand DNA-binding protein|nr:single-stranded DNA-binding protein [Succinivibrio sp.]